MLFIVRLSFSLGGQMVQIILFILALDLVENSPFVEMGLLRFLPSAENLVDCK
jgi:hypothetical protein